LSFEDVTIERSTDVSDATQRLDRPKPSVVILDSRLPTEEVGRLLVRLRRDPIWRTLPILLLVAPETTTRRLAQFEQIPQALVCRGPADTVDLVRTLFGEASSPDCPLKEMPS
jgi:DNA-binding response OmpR family regulator